MIMTVPAAIATTANPPWFADARADIGKYRDGPDVPMLARSVAAMFPEDEELAAYVTMAGNSTAWCGIYVAAKLARYGRKPPLKDTGVGGFMYVDSWKDYEAPVAFADRRPGDIALWMTSSLHHMAFVSEDGKYIGGNQSNTVTETTFPTPTVIRRVTTWEGAKPLPFSRPMLMRESVGSDVVVLQKALLDKGFDIGPDGADGEFGENTELAVRAFQARAGIEVDGIVGPETWAAFFDKPLPLPSSGTLPPAVVEAIVKLAKAEPVAKLSWPDRGVAPIGYTCGMAVEFAKVYRDLKAGKSYALAMVRPLGPRDALSHYGISPPTLTNVFSFLLGLGMRESSGNYTEGRDTTADNVTADTAEAGLFQQSWNSHAASDEITKLLANPPAECLAQIFREGITIKSTYNFGSGDGLKFQKLAKSCPAFAVECAGVGIRVLYDHWGPIVGKEVLFSQLAISMFTKVAALIDALPLDGDVIEPGDEPPPPPPPPADDKTTLILLALLLLLLKERDMSNITGPGQAELDRMLALILAKLMPQIAPPPPPPPPPPAAPTGTPDLNAMLAMILAQLTQGATQGSQQPAPLPQPSPAPQNAPAASPAPATGVAKPSVQLSAVALAVSGILQYLGVLGTPFGMGENPTDVGTAAILGPALTAIVGATGAFGSVGAGVAKFLATVGQQAAKYQPPKK